MFCAEIVERIFFFTYLITLGKILTFPIHVITKFNTNRSLSYLSVNEFRIKMRPQRLIHDINKPVLNLYFRFQFFIRKLDNSLSTLLIIRLKRILMIDKKKCD